VTHLPVDGSVPYSEGGEIKKEWWTSAGGVGVFEGDVGDVVGVRRINIRNAARTRL